MKRTIAIKQHTSLAYNPKSQGALEIFHQTLKNMMWSYWFDAEKHLDEAIYLLIFATREDIQKS